MQMSNAFLSKSTVNAWGVGVNDIVAQNCNVHSKVLLFI